MRHKGFKITIGVLFCLTLLFYFNNKDVPNKSKGQSLAYLVGNHEKEPEIIDGVIEVSIDLNKKTLHPISNNLLGYNTASLYTSGLLNNKEFSQTIKSLQPKVLRFPGGTVANYYHPNGFGFGFKKEEVGLQKKMMEVFVKQKTQKNNAIEDFIATCKVSNSKALYVANVLNGTPDEMILVLKRIQEAGIEIVGIELGNELYFKEYRKQIPNVKSYINKCLPFVKAIKNEFPTIKIGALVPKMTEENNFGNGPFFREWNLLLSKELFYDAIVVHNYTDCKLCNETKAKKEAFDCGLKTINLIANHWLENLSDYYRNYFKDKEIWLTEYNFNKPHEKFGNTILQGLLLSEYMMQLINSERISVASVHQLASEIAPFSLIYGDDKSLKLSVEYYVYQSFGNIFSNSEINVAKTNFKLPPNVTAPNCNLQTIVSNDKVYVYFVNKSGQELRIKVTNKNLVFKQQYKISGQFPWSDMMVSASKKREKEKGNVLHFYNNQQSFQILKPYCFGYFQYELNE